MNGMKIELTAGQIAILLELLKPYTELSLQLSNQYRVQTNAGAMAGAVKAEKIEKTEVKNG